MAGRHFIVHSVNEMTSPRPGAPVCVSVDASQNGVLGVRCELPDAVRAAQARRRGEQLQHELHLQLDLLKLDLVRKTATFFEFSLCLSRACLGKMIVFIYKWL
jgi:hypothetical protein